MLFGACMVGSGFPYCRYFFGTDFADFTDFFSFGGIQLRPFGYMPRHFKRGITGRNITVMVRRIDTYQGFKSQLPKGFQVFFGTDFTDYTVFGWGGYSSVLSVTCRGI